MKIFTNKDIRRLFATITIVMILFILLTELTVYLFYQEFSLSLLSLSLLASCAVLGLCFHYFSRQNKLMEDAVSVINAYLAGNDNARIDCDDEGEMYKLFHSVNTLATVLNAHAQKEKHAKDFLRSTISDISHQLKTPLAALNIYNGILQDEAQECSSIREFVTLSEQELDRIDMLVQNLLKIAKLDVGSMIMEKKMENVANMMRDIELYFTYRAKQERKEMILTGGDDVILLCDRDWMMEAVSNLVKNAFDHTSVDGHIWIEWKQVTNLIQIAVKDDGGGIHPEDIHHIFKRFYRSRFTQDTSGIGLGLPLAKAIVEAHDGDITVDSVWGDGSIFVISFLIPTNL